MKTKYLPCSISIDGAQFWEMPREIALAYWRACAFLNKPSRMRQQTAIGCESSVMSDAVRETLRQKPLSDLDKLAIQSLLVGDHEPRLALLQFLPVPADTVFWDHEGREPNRSWLSIGSIHLYPEVFGEYRRCVKWHVEHQDEPDFSKEFANFSDAFLEASLLATRFYLKARIDALENTAS